MKIHYLYNEIYIYNMPQRIEKKRSESSEKFIFIYSNKWTHESKDDMISI